MWRQKFLSLGVPLFTDPETEEDWEDLYKDALEVQEMLVSETCIPLKLNLDKLKPSQIRFFFPHLLAEDILPYLENQKIKPRIKEYRAKILQANDTEVYFLNRHLQEINFISLHLFQNLLVLEIRNGRKDLIKEKAIPLSKETFENLYHLFYVLL
ncbi:Hypothetical protein BQ3484_499 [Cedratvirus A11]|uniref:Uncharacterized protein n=1 Tax=Cedratvirus A11 TaxID=1903266 RepID=A0A1M7XV82_9VIRU|nr:Hypothetical protein BQ3484_499 [Cedratvirus A11]SHO33567.1 Hypothetical protein BQ3484_499 [Cedratvirus A11]